MRVEDWVTFLTVEETKEASTVSEMLRILRRMQGRGFRLEWSKDREKLAEFLKAQKPRGRSEYKNNVAVVNSLLRWQDAGKPFPFPKKKRAVPSRLKPREIELLRAYRHQDPLVMLRNRALVEFALQTAMRRVETARFNAGDLDDAEATLEISKPAKGGLARTIPLDPEFVKPRGAMMSWLRARPIVGHDPEAVWVGMPTGRPTERMSDIKVGQLLQKIGTECGVRASFRRARHTRATELLRRGFHIRYLQYYLGHADISSTMIYLEADDVDLKREFDRLRKGKP